MAKTKKTRAARSSTPQGVAAPPPFKQPRAHATYEALLEAAGRVFARRGYDAAQTPEIAAAAGVSTGAFYRYFSDKRQAFIEIAARRFAASQAEVFSRLSATRFEEGSRRRGIEQVIDIVFEQFRRNIELEREVLAMSLRDATVEKLRVDFERASVEMLAQVIEQWTDRERVPNPRAAALLLQLLALEVAADRGGLRPQVAAVTDLEARTALVDLVERYLFSPPRESAATSTAQPSSRKIANSRGRAAMAPSGTRTTRPPSSRRPR